MAAKYLHRLIRSGRFFFPSAGTHQSSNRLKLKHMQGPSGYHWDHMQRAPVRSIRASSLPLQGSPRCLPSSSAACNSSADEDEYITATVEVVEEDLQKQLPRSHSFSKQQSRQLVPASFKSRLHRASSHSHLHDTHHGHQSCKLHGFSGSPTSVSKYTRSWSSPRRHLIKVPQIFSSTESRSGLKCAPKGHVAVYVEAGQERHVVPIAYLSHPHFQVLLKRAESEFGFRQQGPGLHIPCSLSELHHTLDRICAH